MPGLGRQIIREITGPQIRAARALLGWSGADLARRAGISYPTVQRAETTATGIPGKRLYNLIAFSRHWR